LNSSINEAATCSIQAYKSDNAKLIKENNELHLELIKLKDDFEAKFKGYLTLFFPEKYSII